MNESLSSPVVSEKPTQVGNPSVWTGLAYTAAAVAVVGVLGPIAFGAGAKIAQAVFGDKEKAEK